MGARITYKLVISHCNNCKDKLQYPSDFIIPASNVKCTKCRVGILQFYAGDPNNLKTGGVYKMADKQPEKKAEPVKKKKQHGYGKEIKDKVVKLAKEGKTVSEIVKAVNGPKAKAVERYCRAAGVEVKKEVKKEKKEKK